MRLPVRLETTVRTENRTAAAVPDALYALKGATLLSTASAIWSACLLANGPIHARHSYQREKLQQSFPTLSVQPSDRLQNPRWAAGLCIRQVNNRHLNFVATKERCAHEQDATPAEQQTGEHVHSLRVPTPSFCQIP